MNISGTISSIRWCARNSKLIHKGPFGFAGGSSRNVFILPKKKKVPKRVPKKIRTTETYKPETPSREAIELEQKVRALKEQTRQLNLMFKKAEQERLEEKVRQASLNTQDIDETSKDDADLIFESISQPEGSLSKGRTNPFVIGDGTKSSDVVQLFDTPAKGIDLPQTVLSKIGDGVKNIVSRDHQNWDEIINVFQNSETRLTDLQLNDLNKLTSQIPKGTLSIESLTKYHEMLHESLGYEKLHHNHYDFFIREFSNKGDLTVTESLYQQFLADGQTPSKYIYSYMINLYCKKENLQKVNQVLQIMSKEGINPGLVVYSQILQLCVNLNDGERADDIFQMMKFKSMETKPDIIAYNKMILLASQQQDVLKALDLYNEISLDKTLEPNLFTLNSMANCCSKKKQYLMKGWEFIHEINERNFQPNLKTFETMLRLSAKDGDLELARTLYLSIFQMRSDIPTAGGPALVFLLMAYRDFKPNKIPLMQLHEAGDQIRRNALGLADFLGLEQKSLDEVNPKNRPPLLPLSTLVNKKQIIAESNAVWSYHLLNDPEQSFNTHNLITYLRIAVEQDDKEEFLRRWEQHTYANPEINSPGTIEIIQEDETSNDKTTRGTDEDDLTKDLKINDTPEGIKMLMNKNFKIERDSKLYLTLLSAGKRFKDLDMCEKAWVERGKYRNTQVFKKLGESNKSQRDLFDYQFAQEMVYAFTELGHLEDAVKIVKSTKNQFDWTFYVLKPLYFELQKIEDMYGMRTISTICNTRKGQILPGMIKPKALAHFRKKYNS